MARIFISYSHADRDKAEALAKALSSLGHKVWWDKNLRPGEDFTERIEENIGKAEAVVVIWTHTSIDSRWVVGEALCAHKNGKLVPVRFEPKIVPRAPLNKLHIESLIDWKQQKNAPEIDRLNMRISDLKAASDAEKLAQLAPVALREIVQESASLKVLLDTALPGGLRVYRLSLGAFLTGGAIWLGLYISFMVLDGDQTVGIWNLAVIVGVLMAARVCNQFLIAAKGRSVDRFFDPSFAFFCLTSLLLGMLSSIVSRLFLPLDLPTLIDQAVAISLWVLVGIYGLRAMLLAVAALQQRID